MAYSIEIKNEVIKKISEGEKIKEISDRMGISVPTSYKWRKENQLDNKNMDDVDLAEQKETSKEIEEIYTSYKEKYIFYNTCHMLLFM